MAESSEESLDAPIDENFISQPKLLLMGLRRSGKSSIQKVVFHKMAPSDTLYLESTNQIIKDDISSGSYIQFKIWDCPGQNDYLDPNYYDLQLIFGTRGAIIFVIDAQEDYNDALNVMQETFVKAYKINPDLKFEVFIHKMDCIGEDYKIDVQRDIHQRATEDLREEGLMNLHISFHSTSIYDHSIYEAFSKVVQKLIIALPTLENMLTLFASNTGIEKVFLFDIVSKIYVATDINQVEMVSYELCCDMIDVALDISLIYGENSDDAEASGYDSESAALIRLNTQSVLYLKEVNKHLALVCIVNEANFKRRGTIDYNLGVLRKGINKVLALSQQIEAKKAAEAASASLAAMKLDNVIA